VNGSAQRLLLLRSSTRTRTLDTGRRRDQNPTYACIERTDPMLHLVGRCGQDLLDGRTQIQHVSQIDPVVVRLRSFQGGPGTVALPGLSS
jgi:hypothetical protein